jgi:hypothetical protein
MCLCYAGCFDVAAAFRRGSCAIIERVYVLPPPFPLPLLQFDFQGLSMVVQVSYSTSSNTSLGFRFHLRLRHQHPPSSSASYCNEPAQIFHHRLGSEPPPDSEDVNPLPADARFRLILGSSTTSPLGGVFNLFMPLHDKAPSLHCNYASAMPLLLFADDLPSDGTPSSRSRVTVVIGTFSQGLYVRLML